MCAVRAVLERLERLESAEGAESHARREMLRQNIDRVKQLKLQGTALNGTQRSITTAAIAIALGWGPGMANLACRTSTPTPAMSPPTRAPALALPSTMDDPEPAPPGLSDASSSPASPPDPQARRAVARSAASPGASPVYAVRDRILGAARSARVPEPLRRAALAAIQTPEVGSWIEMVNLPLDVAALAILTAARTKLEGSSGSLSGPLRRSRRCAAPCATSTPSRRPRPRRRKARLLPLRRRRAGTGERRRWRRHLLRREAGEAGEAGEGARGEREGSARGAQGGRGARRAGRATI